MTAKEYQALCGTQKRAQVERTAPEPNTEKAQPAASIVEPMRGLTVEVSGYTFANNLKRVVTLCPAAHAAALKQHIEAFKP